MFKLLTAGKGEISNFCCVLLFHVPTSTFMLLRVGMPYVASQHMAGRKLLLSIWSCVGLP